MPSRADAPARFVRPVFFAFDDGAATAGGDRSVHSDAIEKDF
jgi:hypothetical protein